MGATGLGLGVDLGLGRKAEFDGAEEAILVVELVIAPTVRPALHGREAEGEAIAKNHVIVVALNARAAVGADLAGDEIAVGVEAGAFGGGVDDAARIAHAEEDGVWAAGLVDALKAERIAAPPGPEKIRSDFATAKAAHSERFGGA